jgi:hypothetical protein
MQNDGVMVPARAVGYLLYRDVEADMPLKSMRQPDAKTEIGTSRSKFAHRSGHGIQNRGGKNEARNRVIIGTADNWVRSRNH